MIYNEYMDYESFNIDISGIKNSDKVCWQYTTDPPIDEIEEWEENGSIFYRLNPKTEALAVASDHVHLRKITASNILEWYYRLDALFDAGVAFMFVDSLEGEVPIRINIVDLKDHIGFKVDCTVWENSKFDNYCRSLRMKQHLRDIIN